MADKQPAPDSHKTSFIAPLILAGVVAALLAVVVLRPSPRLVAPPTPEKEKQTQTLDVKKLKPPPGAPPSAVLLPSALTRKDLIERYLEVAGSVAATGRQDKEVDPFIGRRFSIRLSFGCNNPQTDASVLSATTNYDADNQSVTLRAQPAVWTTLPLIQELSDVGKIEEVEGFWVPRPWVRTEGCPPPLNHAAPATPTPPTSPTLGLAQMFAAGGSRLFEHANKPYTFTRKISPDGFDILGHSYRLLLEGTITGFLGGQSVRCWIEAPDHQPVCLYAVTFDHVAFEDGNTGEVLANWNS